jgi:hypothetical protein
MLRYLVLLAAVMAGIALITRSPRLKRALKVVLAVLGVYAVLKLTGVVEAIAPDRDGVF